jgi:hypothetical protein
MNAAPPKISNPVLVNTWFAAIILGAVALGIAAIIFFFNPTTYGFYPVCQFHKLTGLNCPGCGSTRALYALLHGNFSTALRDNALFVFLLAAAGARGILFAVKKFRDQPTGEIFPIKFFWPLLFIAIVFTVLRNLPAFSFLSPA